MRCNRIVMFMMGMLSLFSLAAYGWQVKGNPVDDSIKQKVEANYNPARDSVEQKGESKMQITSTAFKEGDTIPVKYTCDGPDLSPPLAFSDIPTGAKSLALICDDPDAPMGTWVHWALYSIPPNLKGLPENVLKVVTPILKIDGKEIAMMQGANSSKKYGYNGPCPPSGVHRYYFKLYALDFELRFDREEVAKGVTKAILLEKIKGHVLSEASLMGRYQRKG